MTRAPDAVPCPCGEGDAEPAGAPICREPATSARRQMPGGQSRHDRTVHVYRHEGCPIGGHVVVEAGRVVRRAGPLFEPERFGFGPGGETVRGDTAPAATGGVAD